MIHLGPRKGGTGRSAGTPVRAGFLRAAVLTATAISMVGCAAPKDEPARSPSASSSSIDENGFMDELQERTFRYFWDLSHPVTGLTPDRAPTESFASVAATGFALTAYPIGAERGYVSREDARDRVLTTLEFLWNAPQGDGPSGFIGTRGFFYHFLDPGTGHRFGTVELSTVDTALLIAGALFCREYFDHDNEAERRIGALADSLYARVDWQWASTRPPTIGHGWNPESGHLPYDWRGYNEAMLVYLLALGSPTHAVDSAAWSAWTERYTWGQFHGEEFLQFAPLFGHQYTHVWIDLKGIQDDYLRARGIDYFENSRRAVLAQQKYAIANPGEWVGYGEHLWGLTACDGPVGKEVEIDGRVRRFETYWARGASSTLVQDDGTIAPTAAAASIAFAPEIVVPTLVAMREAYGERIFGEYGFLDALNPTFRAGIPVQHGRVDPEFGWFDTDYLGIDQGPIVAMIENHRTGLVWQLMRRNDAVVRGLRAAGFAGGWLDEVAP